MNLKTLKKSFQAKKRFIVPSPVKKIVIKTMLLRFAINLKKKG